MKKYRKTNRANLGKWIILFLFMLPIFIVIGAVKGIIQVCKVAHNDIWPNDSVFIKPFTF
jgi:hypothetical protein